MRRGLLLFVLLIILTVPAFAGHSAVQYGNGVSIFGKLIMEPIFGPSLGGCMYMTLQRASPTMSFPGISSISGTSGWVSGTASWAVSSPWRNGTGWSLTGWNEEVCSNTGIVIASYYDQDTLQAGECKLGVDKLVGSDRPKGRSDSGATYVEVSCATRCNVPGTKHYVTLAYYPINKEYPPHGYIKRRFTTSPGDPDACLNYVNQTYTESWASYSCNCTYW